MEYQHVSVLLNESIKLLNIKPQGIYVDCTLGGGGHAKEILKQLTTGHLYAIDQDQTAIDIARPKLQAVNDHFTIIKGNFVNLKSLLAEKGINKVDGILYDLGVSSFQFDMPERGFSYRTDNILDMRMDQDSTINAKDIVNNYSLEHLTKIFQEYGEEKYSYYIAKKIIECRSQKEIQTTQELVDIIKAALPSSALRKSGHPAKQVFQALRIEVNEELFNLKQSLIDALSLLNEEGRVVVITFHSLEDRIVKKVFKEKITLNLPKDLPYIPQGYQIEYQLINNKVILPSDKEQEKNPRSHSAKLRAIKKLKL